MPVKKGKSARVARALRAKEPQVIEGAKQLLVIKGPNTSEDVVHVMKDMSLLKKPDVKLLQRKNDIRPFEDVTSLEFLAGKNDCTAFLYGSHNKKRPHNLVLGRLFDGHIYDMIELGITKYSSLAEHSGAKKAVGSVPLMVFAGELWERSKTHESLRNMIIDVFGARDITGLALEGIDHVISVVATDDNIYFRPYSIDFMAAEGRIPRVELMSMGPDIDFEVRRSQFPSSDLTKVANKVPKELVHKKVKNITTDELGETVGRIHMERQDFSRLELKKTKAVKGLKRSIKEISKGDETAEKPASRPAKKSRGLEVDE